MKNLKKILLIVVVVLAGLVVLKDIIIRTSVTTVGSQIVGAPIKMGGFSLGLLTQKIHIKNFQLYNPPGFSNSPMIDIPEIRVDYDLGALIGGKLHFKLVMFNLKEMLVEKDKEGKLNVDSLKVVEEQKAAAGKKKETKAEPASKKETKEMALAIDVLKLNVERVVYKDHSKGEPAATQVFEVALKDKEFKNITSVQQMVTLIMVQSMGPTAIQGAKIYGATAILGAAFLPAGAAVMLTGKDNSTAEFTQSYDKVFDAALSSIKESGELKSENRSTGVIKAKVSGADVTLKLEKGDNKVQATVSARQMLIPKPEVAGGVIYQLQEKLK